MFIFVTGITLNDISYSSIIEDKINYKVSYDIGINIEPLPTFFTDLEHWPKSTNLFCWATNKPFNDIPKTIPVKYDYNNGKFRIKVVGCFSTWECAKVFLHTVRHPEIKEKELKQIEENLLNFANEYFHANLKCIKPIEPFYKTLEYSGIDFNSDLF